MDIISPNGGETWAAESKHHITWRLEKGFQPSDVLKIEYTTDDGRNWIEISKSAPSKGKFTIAHKYGERFFIKVSSFAPDKGLFLWELPGPVTGKCKVRISDEKLGISAQSKSSFSIVPSQKVSDYKWTNVTMKAAFPPRDGGGAVTFNGKMWLLGGWNPHDKVNFPRICNNEVWSSVDGLDWTAVKPNTFGNKGFDPNVDWEGRHTAGYAAFKSKMWIIGGDANQGNYHNDVWNTVDGKTWTHVNKGAKVPWGPRVLHYTVVFKNKIWVMGGQTLSAGEKDCFYADVWNSSDGINWEEVIPAKPYWPQRGMIGGSVVLNDRIWILGGGTYHTPQLPHRNLFNDVWSSPDGVNWKCHVEHAPWVARQYHDVAAYDGRMWVMEGGAPVNSRDVWYSADGVNWYELPKTPWKPRHAASVFVHDNALWMVAGNNMQSDVWKLQRMSTARK